MLELNEVREGGDVRPALFIGGAQRLRTSINDTIMAVWKPIKHILIPRDLEDLRQLIEIGVAGQERNAEQELCQDATHCPDIHPNLG